MLLLLLNYDEVQAISFGRWNTTERLSGAAYWRCVPVALTYIAAIFPHWDIAIGHFSTSRCTNPQILRENI
jgi:hypothetical protein